MHQRHKSLCKALGSLALSCTLKSPRRHARAELHWSWWPLEPKLEPWEKFSRTSKTPCSMIQSHPTILAWGWDTSEKALYQCPAFGSTKNIMGYYFGMTNVWHFDVLIRLRSGTSSTISTSLLNALFCTQRGIGYRIKDCLTLVNMSKHWQLDKFMWKHCSISSWPPIWFMPTSKDTRVPSLSGGRECMWKPISPSLPIYAPNSKRASQKGWVTSSLRSMDKTEVCGIAMYSWSSMICLNSKSCEKKTVAVSSWAWTFQNLRKPIKAGVHEGPGIRSLFHEICLNTNS